MAYAHQPVMLEEILKYLAPRPGEKFVDGTLGGGGYTFALARAVGQSGKIISVDLDDLAIQAATEKIKQEVWSNIILKQDNFKNLKTILAAEKLLGKIDGLVLDLGLSSAQLEDETRGFSFKGDHPLDMAFGPANKERSTLAILNTYSLEELTRIFREYGEERRAYQIAKAIVSARRQKKILRTADLVAVIETVIPPRFYQKIHPATRIFQALRLETNQELEVLSEVLEDAGEILAPGGRLVVVSFHSGEDRIVKRFLKNNPAWRVLNKKPLLPTEAEIDANPRARSAKLRAAVKNEAAKI